MWIGGLFGCLELGFNSWMTVYGTDGNVTGQTASILHSIPEFVAFHDTHSQVAHSRFHSLGHKGEIKQNSLCYSKQPSGVKWLHFPRKKKKSKVDVLEMQVLLR